MARRQRGEIEVRSNGSLRVRVYAGIDPLSGKRHYLVETFPAGKDARKEAEKVQRRLATQVDEQRNPRTKAMTSRTSATRSALATSASRSRAPRSARFTSVSAGRSPAPSAGAGSPSTRSTRPSRLARGSVAEPDPPTAAQAARILASAFDADLWWACFLWLAMVTGARRGELYTRSD